MNVQQYKKHIVIKVLKELGMYSEQAVMLVMGTFYQESNAGEYLVQLGDGPAKGFLQVEPFTANDNFENYLNFKPKLKEKVMKYYNEKQTMEENLTGNLFFNVAMARIKYYRDSKPIPSTLQGVAEYWKRVYNSKNGKGTTEEFVSNFNKYNKEN